MLGKETRTGKLFYQFNLEDRVPADHLLRRVAGAVEFSFVRRLTGRFYSHTGPPSVDPVVLFKIALIGYVYGITSERRPVEEIDLHLAYRWFVGDDLDGAIPDRSVLSKARKRFGPRVYRAFFAEIVRQCDRAGPIRGDKLSVDRTLVAADAALDRSTAAPWCANSPTWAPASPTSGATTPRKRLRSARPTRTRRVFWRHRPPRRPTSPRPHHPTGLPLRFRPTRPYPRPDAVIVHPRRERLAVLPACSWPAKATSPTSSMAGRTSGRSAGRTRTRRWSAAGASRWTCTTRSTNASMTFPQLGGDTQTLDVTALTACGTPVAGATGSALVEHSTVNRTLTLPPTAADGSTTVAWSVGGLRGVVRIDVTESGGGCTARGATSFQGR